MILVLQGNGDYDGVSKLVNEKGIISKELQADLDKLSKMGIPVDVTFEQGVEVLQEEKKKYDDFLEHFRQPRKSPAKHSGPAYTVRSLADSSRSRDSNPSQGGRATSPLNMTRLSTSSRPYHNKLPIRKQSENSMHQIVS